jgi:hypothetical protein
MTLGVGEISQSTIGVFSAARINVENSTASSRTTALLDLKFGHNPILLRKALRKEVVPLGNTDISASTLGGSSTRYHLDNLRTKLLGDCVEGLAKV